MNQVVLAVAKKFDEQIKVILSDRILDTIVHGSSVDGGFIEGKGDIDFLVVVNTAISDVQYEALIAYHKGLRERGGLLGQFEGCYLVVDEESLKILSGVYIGSTISRWRPFEGDIFSDLFKAHVCHCHYSLHGARLIESIFTFEWVEVEREIQMSLVDLLDLFDKLEDDEFKLHALHVGARSLYTYKNRAFITKVEALMWLASLSDFIDYEKFLVEMTDYRSLLTESEKCLMRQLPLGMTKVILEKIQTYLLT
jgi:predicted nucleotidyltransferase